MSLFPNVRAELKQDFQPVLVWYDLQPNNILIGGNCAFPELTGWLDPGAARMGPAYWDLAHAKQYLCSLDDDWISLLKGYEEIVAIKNIEICRVFQVLVLLDDLALSLVEELPNLTESSLTKLTQIVSENLQ